MLNAYQGSPIRSLPPLVGRSEREPPQDGSEYKTIELIALRLRDALRRRVLSTPSDDGKPQTPAAFGRNSGFGGCQRTPLVRELLAKKILVRVDRRRSARSGHSYFLEAQKGLPR